MSGVREVAWRLTKPGGIETVTERFEVDLAAQDAAEAVILQAFHGRNSCPAGFTRAVTYHAVTITALRATGVTAHPDEPTPDGWRRPVQARTVLDPTWFLPNIRRDDGRAIDQQLQCIPVASLGRILRVFHGMPVALFDGQYALTPEYVLGLGEIQVRWPAQVADLVFEAIGGRGGWEQVRLSDHYDLVERLTRGES